MWWAGKAGGAPAGGGVFSTERRAPSPAPLARPLPLAGEVLPPSLTLSAAARMPDRTSPASTEGSWSGSPRRTRRAPSGTASTSLAISGRSIIEASSTTTTSNGSGLSAWCRNRGLSGMVPSRRCRVVPVVGRWSSRAWSMPRAGSAWMAVRTLSAMRSAARPVGAARAMRGGGLPACRAWATRRNSMRVMVVVLPVPGPPVTRRRGWWRVAWAAWDWGVCWGEARSRSRSRPPTSAFREPSPAGGGGGGAGAGGVWGSGWGGLGDQGGPWAGGGWGLGGGGGDCGGDEGVGGGVFGGVWLWGVWGGSKIKVKIKGALIRPSGTFSRRREKGLLRGGFGFARGVRGLGWVGRGLGEELGEEWGQGLGAGGVEGVGADAVAAGGEVAFVFAVAAEVRPEERRVGEGCVSKCRFAW